jgi:hypothetical protein
VTLTAAPQLVKPIEFGSPPDSPLGLTIQRPPMERASGLRPAGVVLHVDDHPLVQFQNVRPLMPPAGLVGPREHDRDAPVALLEPIDSQVVIAVPVSPLDL